jgi:hypothetical protein
MENFAAMCLKHQRQNTSIDYHFDMVLQKEVGHFPQHNINEEAVSGQQVSTLPFTAQQLLGACIVNVVISVTEIVY